MSHYKKILILILLFFSQSCYALAQNNYSNAAIAIYNEGAQLQNQGKHALAEQKYIQVLKLQPDFAEAKKNLATIYPNLASKYYSEGAYEKSIYYAKKSLGLKPDNIDAHNIMAQCYSALNDNENAVAAYNKILVITPNDTSAMHSVAQIYIKSNRLDAASSIYKKILSIEPDDKIAQQNLKYVNYHSTEKSLSDSINRLSIQHIAPVKLYRLIKPEPGVTPETVEKMKTILDYIWSDSSGRIILEALLKNKTNINITQGYTTANAMKSERKNTFYLYGFIPIGSLTRTSTAVNIPYTHISNFNNPNLTSRQRIYNLHVFIHEFGHSFMNIKNPTNTNSIEEELGVSMIGYNISHKVITGEYLDRNQTKTYSTETLKSLLSDDHRELPVFGSFNNCAQAFGVILPYPDIYSNIPLMYKSLLLEDEITPVSSFYQYVK